MPIVVTSGRTPFEVTILAGAMAAGLSLLATDESPQSVVESMPAVLQSTWEVALLAAGLVGLVGVYWLGEISTGLGVELGAVLVLGTSTLMYAIALAAISGMQALAAGAFIAAIAVAALWRSGQIGRDLLRLARACPDGEPC